MAGLPTGPSGRDARLDPPRRPRDRRSAVHRSPAACSGASQAGSDRRGRHDPRRPGDGALPAGQGLRRPSARTADGRRRRRAARRTSARDPRGAAARPRVRRNRFQHQTRTGSGAGHARQPGRDPSRGLPLFSRLPSHRSPPPLAARRRPSRREAQGTARARRRARDGAHDSAVPRPGRSARVPPPAGRVRSALGAHRPIDRANRPGRPLDPAGPAPPGTPPAPAAPHQTPPAVGG